MFCEKCGKEIPDSTKFCPYCGAAVSKAQVLSTKQERPSMQQSRSLEVHLMR